MIIQVIGNAKRVAIPSTIHYYCFLCREGLRDFFGVLYYFFGVLCLGGLLDDFLRTLFLPLGGERPSWSASSSSIYY